MAYWERYLQGLRWCTRGDTNSKPAIRGNPIRFRGPAIACQPLLTALQFNVGAPTPAANCAILVRLSVSAFDAAKRRLQNPQFLRRSFSDRGKRNAGIK